MLQYRLWQAREALGRRDADEALQWLDKAARLKPGESEIAFLRARAYRRLGQPEPFRQQLLSAAELKYPVAILQREEALMLAQQGQLPPDAPQLSALMIDPGNDTMEIYEAVVQGYLKTYRVNQALVLLDGWESDAPNDPLPHYFRGMIAVNNEVWQDASDQFREALRLGCRRPGTRRRLADALRKGYHYRKALWHYERCGDDERDEVLLGRGKCLQALSDVEGAREAYGELLERSPDHFEGLLALGRLEYSQGEYQKAAEYLEKAVQQNPNDFNAQHALAWALLILGDRDQARSHFKRAVKVRFAMHLTENLQRRIEKEPGNTDLRYELGRTLMDNHREDDGLFWLQSVLQLDPHHRPSNLALADYYAKHGNAELADRHRRAAMAR